MSIFDKVFGRRLDESTGDVNSLSGLELANLPKDKRLKDFYGMKSFAHYIGYGGEHLVTAELLLRGINVSKPIVDEGVDLVVFGKTSEQVENKNESSTTDDKTSVIKFVQVKTAFLDSERDRYSFNLSFVHKDSEIAYVFVLVYKAGVYNFLVMSASDIHREIKKGSIYFNKATNRYKTNIYFRNNKLFLGTLKNEVSGLLNNWKLFGGGDATEKRTIEDGEGLMA